MAVRLRLMIRPVPEPIKGVNLSNLAKPEAWKRLRRKVLDAGAGRCAVCRVQGRLNCHEKWQYVEKRRVVGVVRVEGISDRPERWKLYAESPAVARLVGFEALCSLCHAVRHFDNVDRWGPGGPKKIAGRREKVEEFKEETDAWIRRTKTACEKAVEHFCRVNHCAGADFQRHWDRVLEVRKRRDKRAWQVDLGRWAVLVPAQRRKGRLLLPRRRAQGFPDIGRRIARVLAEVYVPLEWRHVMNRLLQVEAERERRPKNSKRRT